MVLKTTVNAACLVQPKACSSATAHHHLGWHNGDRVNGVVNALCKTCLLRPGSQEADAAGICAGGRHACPILAMLEELGHKQPTNGSPLKTDNKTAHGILNFKMRQKLSKSFDTRHWWMKDRIDQGQFNLLWAHGKFNLANCFTKHHPPWHHCLRRCEHLQMQASTKAQS
jgi:hypothetical protein